MDVSTSTRNGKSDGQLDEVVRKYFPISRSIPQEGESYPKLLGNFNLEQSIELGITSLRKLPSRVISRLARILFRLSLLPLSAYAATSLA